MGPHESVLRNPPRGKRNSAPVRKTLPELMEAANTLPHAGGAHGHIPYRAAGTTTHDTTTDGFVWATNRGGHQKSLTLR